MLKKIKTNNDFTWRVDSSQSLNYDVEVIKDIFNPKNQSLLKYGSEKESNYKRRIIFVDDFISSALENKINSYFQINKINHKLIKIFCSEENKNLETLMAVLKEIEHFGVSRRGEPIIVIGGGVLLDIVAFAASIYRRGVPYIKIPTTLLGIVDASVGVKTSINHFDRRNRLGSYHCPLASLLDPLFLQTLPEEEMSYGLGEIIKIAVIKDKDLFNLLENNSSELLIADFYLTKMGNEIISKSIHCMLEELNDNLHETDLKRVVDFGHSFGPVPEMRSLIDDSVFSLAHGQAVTLDIIISCCISLNRNMISKEDLNRVLNLIEKCGLKIFHPYFFRPELLWESLNDATRHRDGNQNLPLPLELGKAMFCNDLDYSELQSAITVYKNLIDNRSNE